MSQQTTRFLVASRAYPPISVAELSLARCRRGKRSGLSLLGGSTQINEEAAGRTELGEVGFASSGSLVFFFLTFSLWIWQAARQRY